MLGLAHASVANYDEAIRVLQTSGNDAATDSDLSAAYLARYATLGEASDLFLAFDLAESAVRRAPDFRPAVFNMAVARSLLKLRGPALKAWEEYSRLETDQHWLSEGREYVRELSGSIEQPWDSADPVTPASASAAREWLTEQMLSGPGVAAGGDHSRIVAVADSVQLATGDSMWALVARERAALESHGAHVAMAALLAAREANDLPLSTNLVKDACPALLRIASPLHLYCELEQGAIEYLHLDYASAHRRFREVQAAAAAKGFAWLHAKATANLGTLQLAQQQFSQAAATLQEASRLLERVAAWSDLAGLDTQRADLLNLLGRQDEAWGLRAGGLVRAAEVRRLETDRQVYSSASVYCLNVGLTHAALIFSRLPEEELPGLAEVARLQRVLRATTAVGDVPVAWATLADIKARLGASDDPRARTMAADVAVGEGLLLAREGRYVEAAASIEAGISQMGPVRHRQRTDALVWLAEIEMKLDRHDAARSRLDAASHLVANRQGLAAGADTTLDERGWIWDRLSDLVLASGGSDAAANIRLLDGVKSGWRLSSSGDGQEIFSAGDPWIYFVCSDDRIGAWVHTDGLLRFRTTSASPSTVAALLSQLREQFQSPTGEGAAAVLERLRQEVLAPFEADIAGLQRLHIVPDGILLAVPFPGLRNRSTGKYLVEEVELRFSRTLHPVLSAPALSHQVPGGNVLLIGEPAAASTAPLPGARDEVEAIATLYPGRPASIVGAAATEAAVRSALSSASVVHFAGHAVATPQSPGRSHLLLAAGLGSPDDDGIFSVAELRGLVLTRRPLVILAACETAGLPARRRLGAVNLADEFLAAGAGGVVAAVDEIPDASSSLYVRLHAQLAQGVPPAPALRAAQLGELGALGSGHLESWVSVMFYVQSIAPGVRS